MAANTHSVQFFGLSTCIHCKHAREYLEKHQVPFELHYVDLAEGNERASLLEKVRAFNPNISFPTIVIDNAKVVVGFQPETLAADLNI